MSTIEQLRIEADFMAASPLITHTQQMAISILIRKAQHELEALQKANAEMREVLKCHHDWSVSNAKRGELVYTTELRHHTEHALSTDCGKDFVHKSQLESKDRRIAELEKALAKVADCFTNEGLRMRRIATEALENKE